MYIILVTILTDLMINLLLCTCADLQSNPSLKCERVITPVPFTPTTCTTTTKSTHDIADNGEKQQVSFTFITHIEYIV